MAFLNGAGRALRRTYMRFLYRNRPLPLENLCLWWHVTGHKAGTLEKLLARLTHINRDAASRVLLQPLTHLIHLEHSDAGCSAAGLGARPVRDFRRLRLRLRSTLRESAMTFDYTLAAIVTVGLLIYLTYALLQPEKF